MTVIACPHCRELHFIFNGPPSSRICECGGWMEELPAVAQAYEDITTATVTAEEP